ncbi:MAG: pyridoxamine 5'-phosphate oxidase family protein [Candidatus Thorarchaeota archaeon]
MTEIDVKQIAKELISRTLVAYLATINENNEPEIRAVENIRCKEKFPKEAAILEKYEKNLLINYISTNTSSKKIEHIKGNKTIALYYCVPQEYKGVMLKGQVEIVNNLALKKEMWDDSCMKYYPKGYTDPDYTLLKLKPNYIKAWIGLKYGVLEEKL